MNDNEILGMLFGLLVFAAATQTILTTVIQETRQEMNYYDPDLHQF